MILLQPPEMRKLQGVKLGTHKISTDMYAISQGEMNHFASVSHFHQKVNNVGVERGVATRRAQMVWPMMTVTVTNFEGFIKQQFDENERK